MNPHHVSFKPLRDFEAPAPFAPHPSPRIPAFTPRAPLERVLDAPGCWHWRGRGDGTPWPGLPAALEAARLGLSRRPDLLALAEFLVPRMPGLLLASDTLKSERPFSARKPAASVLTTHAWLGFNRPDAVNVLWVESDGEDWEALLDRAVAAGLPEPAWTARGTRGGHAAWVLLTPVVTREDGKGEKPLRLLRFVHAHLREALGGDPAAQLRGMTKNPFHERWETKVGPLVAVHLADMLRPLLSLAREERKGNAWRTAAREAGEATGRNCALFDLVRRRAYREGEKDFATLRAWAAEANAGFATPLREGEVRSVARSIHRFMRTRWRGKARPRMTEEQARAARSAAGRLTSERRRSSRDAALLSVLDRLLSEGKPCTQAALARASGMSLRTVQQAWPSLALARPGRLRQNGRARKAQTAAATSGSLRGEEDGGEAPSSPAEATPAPTPGWEAALTEALVGMLPRDRRIRAPRDGEGRMWKPPQLFRREMAEERRRERVRAHVRAALEGWEAYKRFAPSRSFQMRLRMRDDIDALPLPDLGRIAGNPLSEDWEFDEAVHLWDRRRMKAFGWHSRLRAEERLEGRIRALFLRAAAGACGAAPGLG